jgi:hypothetical protein
VEDALPTGRWCREVVETATAELVDIQLDCGAIIVQINNHVLGI